MTRVNWFSLTRENRYILWIAASEEWSDSFAANFALVWEIGKQMCLPHACIYELLEWLAGYVAFFAQTPVHSHTR